jgi:membrane-bound serine protease (ClpP class)
LDETRLAIMIAVAMGVVILFTAVKLIWGAAQWSQRPQHRVGDRWGTEHVEVVEWSGGTGLVSAGGELWRATSADPLVAGDVVSVAKVNGLTLEVRKPR